MAWGSRHDRSNKFSNQKTQCSLGHAHRSKLESAVCGIYQLREKAREIVFVASESHVYLTEARILYIPDFELRDAVTGNSFWGEAKGYETPEWRIKRRLWEFYGPGPLEIWKGSASYPKLVETLVPKVKPPSES